MVLFSALENQWMQNGLLWVTSGMADGISGVLMGVIYYDLRVAKDGISVD